MQKRFERPRIIRPPHEADSYFLPLTNGCSNGRCGFCNYYYGHRLQLRDLAEVKQEIDALALCMERGPAVAGIPDFVSAMADSWDGRKLFLQDGDALVYPYPRLLEALRYLSERLPGLERLSCFATTPDVLRLSIPELRALEEQKLRLVYLGVESGDDDILREVDKAVTAEQTIEAGRKIKAAGIELAVTVILGLGGQEDSERHALATASVLSEIDPDSAEALTLTLVPGVPMHESFLRGEFSPIPPMRSLEELRILVENSRFTDCLFRSEHESNYLTLHGRLPREKDRLLAELDYVLSRRDSSLLRPESLRGL